MLIGVFFCIVTGNATLVYYGPSIVHEVGITDIKTLGWTMAAIYACGWLGMIGNGYLSDRNQEVRWHTAVAATLGALGLLLSAYFWWRKAPWGWCCHWPCRWRAPWVQFQFAGNCQTDFYRAWR